MVRPIKYYFLPRFYCFYRRAAALLLPRSAAFLTLVVVVSACGVERRRASAAASSSPPLTLSEDHPHRRVLPSERCERRGILAGRCPNAAAQLGMTKPSLSTNPPPASGTWLSTPQRPSISWPQSASHAVEGSYIVAFAASQPSHAQSAARHFVRQSEPWQADPRLKEVRYLGEVRLVGGSLASDQQSSLLLPTSELSASFATFTQAALPSRQSQASVAQLEFRDEQAARELLEEWQAEDRILFAEPNYINELIGGPPAPEADDSQPSYLAPFAAMEASAPVSERASAWGEQADFELLAHYYEQAGQPWWMEQIHMGAAFSLLSQGLAPRAADVAQPPLKLAAVVIAVLDSGVDYAHPALRDKIWRNPRPGLAGCLDDEWGCDTTAVAGQALGRGSAFPFSTRGPDEACPDSPTSWQCMHGTHVAGILVADPYPGGGGLCPVCKVLPIKAVELVEGEGKVTDGAILRALQYIHNLNAQYNGLVKVVNSSFGKFQWSRAVALKIAELRAEGVLFVAAAGNENTQLPVFPAALRETLAVTAVDAEGRKSAYANYGSWVDLAAPGGSLQLGKYASVTGPVPGEGLMPSQGTSVATPMVSGVAALLWAIHPQLAVDEVHAMIVGSANGKLYRSSYGNGYNQHYLYTGADGRRVPLLGSGLLDAEAALQQRQQAPATSRHFDERVQAGCGSVALILPSGRERPPSPPWALIVVLTLPLFMLGAGLRRNYEPSDQ